MRSAIKKSRLYQWLRRARAYEEWEDRSFGPPSPTFVKHAVLLRNGFCGATWVETGTYMGDTTEVLAEHANTVHSLEPDASLASKAIRRFSRRSNVQIHNVASEDLFPALLPTLSGDVCFWLDGHYSGEGTYRGSEDTPIKRELEVVAENLPRYQAAAVMIDDIRLFTGQTHTYGTYPTLTWVSGWAESNGLNWHIEHDILIAARAASE